MTAVATSMQLELIPLMSLWSVLTKKEKVPTVIMEDNQSTMRIMTSGKSAALKSLHRTHNIDVKFVAEQIRREEIVVAYCNTNEQAADIFTKAIADAPKWRAAMGLIAHCYARDLKTIMADIKARLGKLNASPDPGEAGHPADVGAGAAAWPRAPRRISCSGDCEDVVGAAAGHPACDQEGAPAEFQAPRRISLTTNHVDIFGAMARPLPRPVVRPALDEFRLWQRDAKPELLEDFTAKMMTVAELGCRKAYNKKVYSRVAQLYETRAGMRAMMTCTWERGEFTVDVCAFTEIEEIRRQICETHCPDGHGPALYYKSQPLPDGLTLQELDIPITGTLNV
ncbi:MAG: hypothetical protein L6R35_007579, partial [Caloplaca aegaea]